MRISDEKLVEDKLQQFDGFNVNILEDTDNCFIVECCNPESSMYRFVVTCVPSANLITITGDLQPNLMLHAGYNRGIGWLASWDETEEEKLEDMPKPLKRFYETKDHTELISAEHAYTWVSDDLINDWMEGGDFGTSIDYSWVTAGLHYLFNHQTMKDYFKS